MHYVADLSRPLGASWTPVGCNFRVWAPDAQRVEVRVLDPEERLIPMARDRAGYWSAEGCDVAPGARYFYRLRQRGLDGERDRPDPASRHQPEGVHGPSRVTGAGFGWTDDAWRGIPLQKFIIYELHIGTFTPEGTFDGAIARLPDLVDLGVTAIEIMPVAQFPGDRNWGYDGVLPFAVQDSYGGPDGLKRLVDAAHRAGLAVILDVVYNHLGPEGNVFSDFGPYFTDRYRSPWGAAMNFDGPGSDEVRRYFIENAVCWLRDFHLDALRLDAVHAILDFSASTFLEELVAVVQHEALELNRRLYLIGESDLNDSRVVRTQQEHGFGLDAQWADDLHHALHALLTGERQGYYEDFAGIIGHPPPLRYLAAALSGGVLYQGQYAPARGRRHGNSFAGIPAHRFVVCAQNHDQVGNRMLGERLTSLVSQPRLKLAAAVVLLSPYLPQLFMGEEYGESAPFLYFISHTDSALVQAVREGRKEEFAAFMEQGAEPPDPAAVETFERSKLNWRLAGHTGRAELRSFYKELIRLRKAVPALRNLSKENQEVRVFEDARVLAVHRWFGESHALAAFNFGDQESVVHAPVPCGAWRLALRSDADAAAPAELVAEDGRAGLRLEGEGFALYIMGGTV